MKARITFAMTALAVLLHAGSVFGQGILLPATGPINRGMSGATTGAAIESIGSMAWNPATISGLNNELAFGFEALYTSYVIESNFPGAGQGRTGAENGAVPIPSVAWVHQLQNPCAKLGFGLFGVAGYTSNFPTDPTNPILGPPPAQGGVGLGRVQGDVQYFQMPVAVSVQMTDRMSVAFGPTLTIGRLFLDEIPFVAPNVFGSYPRGNGTRYHFGGGAQLGVYYVHNHCLSFGANIKTPSWMEDVRYHTEDINGLPRHERVNIDLPAMITTGLAYRPNQDVIFTADLRYTDYTNAETFGEATQFLPDGSVEGLGWNSILSAHFGTRIRLTHRLYAMLGYVYSEDVLDDANTFFNVGSDLGYEHGFSGGASLMLSPCVTTSLSYSFFPGWGSTGPFVVPGVGPIPGSSITQQLDAHSLTFGVNVNY